MEHKRKLPEDGCLKPLTTSKIGLACNIMIIRVPDEMKKPGELTYRLATCDRSKAGIEWNADKYVDKLIPGLPEVKAPKESRSPLDLNFRYVRKRMDISQKKADIPVSKHHDAKIRSDKKKTEMKKISADDIDPWIKKPWENNSYFDINPVLPMNSSSSLISNSPYNNMDMPGPLFNPVLSMNQGSSFISNSTYTNMDMPVPVCNPLLPMNPSSSPISNSAYNNMNMPGPVHNPVLSMNPSSSLISNSAYNMDMPSPVCNSYGPQAMHNIYVPTNNTIYKNNYNENSRYEGMPGNSYMNNCDGKQRNELMMNRMPDSSQSFVQQSNNGLIGNRPPPRKGLLGDFPASSASFNNFVSFQRENVSLNPKVEVKMFPRKNQKSFVETNPHTINRNLGFGCKNNNESGNFKEIFNHDISNKSYNNWKGNGEVYNKFQKHTKTTYGDMNMGASDNIYESNVDEHPTAGKLTSVPLRNKRPRQKMNKFLNTVKSATDCNITPGRFGNNPASFNNSKVFRMNSLPSKSHLIGNQGGQRQDKKQLPGQYNNRGRYKRQGNVMQ